MKELKKWPSPNCEGHHIKATGLLRPSGHTIIVKCTKYNLTNVRLQVIHLKDGGRKNTQMCGHRLFLLNVKGGRVMGNPFKDLREQLGLKVKDMGLIAGVTLNCIYKTEAGEPAEPWRYALGLEKAGLVVALDILEDYAVWRQDVQKRKSAEARKLLEGVA